MVVCPSSIINTKQMTTLKEVRTSLEDLSFSLNKRLA